MIRQTFLLVVASSFLVPAIASAEASFQFAFPGRNFPEDPEAAARISMFWGNNDRVSYFDLGLGAVSQTRHRSGLGLVFGVSRVTERSEGAVNLAFVNFHTGRDSGINGAFVNMVRDTPGALNLGFIQISGGTTTLDVGGVNVSKQSKVQIGFINVTKRIEGFQLGFINMAENGFFPAFPFFNYAPRSEW